MVAETHLGGVVGSKFLAWCGALLLAATGVTITLVTRSTSPTRTAAAFCSYFYGAGGQLRSQWIAADSTGRADVLSALSTVLGAPAQVAAFLGHAADRAPSEPAADDMRTLSVGYAKIGDSMGDQAAQSVTNPVGVMASSLLVGLQLSGPENRVSDYVLATCGRSPA
jgi:hypothetical protein